MPLLGLTFGFGARDVGMEGALHNAEKGMKTINTMMENSNTIAKNSKLQTFFQSLQNVQLGGIASKLGGVLQDTGNITNGMEAQFTSMAKEVKPIVAQFGVYGKEQQKVVGQINSTAYALNVGASQVAMAWKAMRQAGGETNKTLKNMGLNLSSLVKMESTTGISTDQLVNTIDGLTKSWNFSAKQTQVFLDTMAAVAQRTNLGADVFKNLNKQVAELDAVLAGANIKKTPEDIKKLVLQTQLLAGAIKKSVGGSTEEAMASAMALTKVIVAEQVKIQQRFSGLEGEYGSLFSTLLQGSGFKNINEMFNTNDPIEFAKRMQGITEKLKAMGNSPQAQALLTRLLATMGEINPQLSFFFKNGQATTQALADMSKPLGKVTGAFKKMGEAGFSSGLTLQDAFNRIKEGFETKLRAKVGPETVDFVNTQRVAYADLYKSIDKMSENKVWGPWIKRLLLVNRVGIQGLLIPMRENAELTADKVKKVAEAYGKGGLAGKLEALKAFGIRGLFMQGSESMSEMYENMESGNKTFNKYIAGIAQMGAIAGSSALKMAPLITALPVLRDMGGAVGKSLNALSGGLLGALGPMALFAAKIALIAGAMYLVYKIFSDEKTRTKVTNFFDKARQKFSEFFIWVSKALAELPDMLGNAFSRIGAWFETLNLVGMGKRIGESIIGIVKDIAMFPVKVIDQVFGTGKKETADKMSGFMNGAVRLAIGLFNFAKDLASGLWSGIKKAFEELKTYNWGLIFKNVLDFAIDSGLKLIDLGSKLLNWAISGFKDFAAKLKNAVSGQNIGGQVAGGINTEDFAKKVEEKFKEVVAKIKEKLAGIDWNGLFTGIKDYLIASWSLMIQGLKMAGSLAKVIINLVMDGVNSAFSGIANMDFGKIGGVIGKGVETAIQLSIDVIKIAGDLSERIIVGLTNALNIVANTNWGPKFTSLFKKALLDPIDNALDGLSTELIGARLQKGITLIGNFFISIVDGAVALALGALDLVSMFTDWLNKTLGNAVNAMKEMINNHTFGDLGERIGEYLALAIKKLVIFAGKAIVWVIKMFPKLVVLLVRGIQLAFQGLYALGQLIGGIIWGLVKNLLKHFYDGMIWLGDKLNGLAYDYIVKPIKNALSWLSNMGEEYIIKPLKTAKDGIVSAGATVANWIDEWIVTPISRVFKKIFNFFNDNVIKPLTPLFQELGAFFSKYVTGPLTVAIKAIIDGVKWVIKKLEYWVKRAASAIDAVKEKVEGVSDSILHKGFSLVGLKRGKKEKTTGMSAEEFQKSAINRYALEQQLKKDIDATIAQIKGKGIMSKIELQKLVMSQMPKDMDYSSLGGEYIKKAVFGRILANKYDLEKRKIYVKGTATDPVVYLTKEIEKLTKKFAKEGYGGESLQRQVYSELLRLRNIYPDSVVDYINTNSSQLLNLIRSITGKNTASIMTPKPAVFDVGQKASFTDITATDFGNEVAGAIMGGTITTQAPTMPEIKVRVDSNETLKENKKQSDYMAEMVELLRGISGKKVKLDVNISNGRIAGNEPVVMDVI